MILLAHINKMVLCYITYTKKSDAAEKFTNHPPLINMAMKIQTYDGRKHLNKESI